MPISIAVVAVLEITSLCLLSIHSYSICFSEDLCASPVNGQVAVVVYAANSSPLKTCISDHKICILIKLSCYLSCIPSARQSRNVLMMYGPWQLALWILLTWLRWTGCSVSRSGKEVEKLCALWGENLSMMPIILRFCSGCENGCHLSFGGNTVQHGLK